MRSFVRSFQSSFVPKFVRSKGRSFLRSFVPKFVPSFLRSFVPSFGSSSFVQSKCQKVKVINEVLGVDRLPSNTLVRSFVSWFVGWFIGSFKLSSVRLLLWAVDVFRLCVRSFARWFNSKCRGVSVVRMTVLSLVCLVGDDDHLFPVIGGKVSM